MASGSIVKNFTGFGEDFGRTSALGEDFALLRMPATDQVRLSGRSFSASVDIDDPNVENEDGFGWSLDIDSGSGTFAIGSPGDSTHVLNGGRVHVYRWTGEAAELLMSIDPPLPTENGQFGFAVSITGTQVIVGSPGSQPDSRIGFAPGEMFVYDISSGMPVLVQSIISDEFDANERFGSRIEVDDGSLIVSAPKGFASANDGRIEHHRLVNGRWQFQRSFGTGERSTLAMDIEGNRIAFASENAIEVHTLDDSEPVMTYNAFADVNELPLELALETQTLVAAFPRRSTPDDPFTGRDGEPFAGQIEVFDLRDGTIDQVDVIEDDDPAEFEQFGYSLQIDGGEVLVGMSLDRFGNITHRRALLIDVELPEDDYSFQFPSARHQATGPMLGMLRDREHRKNVSAGEVAGAGDNSTGSFADNDGVTLETLVPGTLTSSATVVVSGAPATLDAWIDFDGNGSLGASEQIIDGLIIEQDGTITIPFDVPPFDDPDHPRRTSSLFRISTEGVSSSVSFAEDGEAEDHSVEILPAPSILSAASVVIIGEGRTATLNGRFSHPIFNADVTLDANVGEINHTSGATGTWTWSLPTTNSERDSRDEVIITATDQNGASRSFSFRLDVLDLPPTVDGDNSSATITVGDQIQREFEIVDPGGDPFTPSVNEGQLTHISENTWRWTYTADRAVDNVVIRISADGQPLPGRGTFMLTVEPNTTEPADTSITRDGMGNLVISDIHSVTDDNIRLLSEPDGFIIEDENQVLTSDIDGATGDQGHSIKIPWESFTGAIFIRSGEGNDSFELGPSIGSNEERIVFDSADIVLTAAESFQITERLFDDGIFLVRMQSSDRTVEIGGLNYRNPRVAHDVDNQNGVTALDALLIINELQRQSLINGPNNELIDINEASIPQNFVDVNGDGRLSALDALQVINELSRQYSTTLSEGEMTVGLLDDEDDVSDLIDLLAQDQVLF